MSKIKVKLKDGSVLKVDKGSSVRDVAFKIGERLGREALAGKVDGNPVDLDYVLDKDCSVEIITFESDEGKNVFWHSSAHVLAQAVLELYPDAKPTIGPSIENGFYYDFDVKEPFKEEDLERIEMKMKEIVKRKLDIKRKEMNRKEALEYYKKRGNKYKIELINEIEGDKISFYEQGDFIDMCRGPHIPNTGMIKAIKLLKVSGAYWKGDERNKMLSRIYGISFPKKKMLDEYLKNLEEAKKRDHRKIGKEMELFMFDDEVGPGLPLWMPKGAMLRHVIMDFAFNTYLSRGYEPVITPHIASHKLWSHSGHLDFYGDSMYQPFGIEGEEYRLKPMNCPLHVKIYKSKKRSYKELPFRWTEMGTVYRYERTGTLHGLTRVRGFTQDDAHIICTPEQLEGEMRKAFELTQYILGVFGFEDIEINLSVRDMENKDKFIGDDKEWEMAEKTLIKIIKESGKDFVYDVGGAVFYGPKIDIKVKDSIGRKWQLSTLQFDFNLPRRFDMKYIDENNNERYPFMIHRALLGSLERFIGVLIEHFGGKFPTWIAPVQVRILTLNDDVVDYAKKIEDELRRNGIRVEEDYRSESLEYKVRDAQLSKVPYMIIVGNKEKENGKISIRRRDNKVMYGVELKKFVDVLEKEIETRSLNLMFSN